MVLKINMDEKLKVLVVDDAAFMRKAIKSILETDPAIEVVDSARNGMEGLEKIKAAKPDVITLDIDMPIMDGLAAIRHIMIESPLPVVVLSSLFSNGAITFDALRLGVVDFVPKPSGAISENIENSKKQIIDRIKIATSVNLDNIRRVRIPRYNVQEGLSDRYGFHPLEYILVIGTTLSGPNTVIRLLTKISPTLPAAIVVVQEISPKIITSFAKKFDEHVPWKVDVAKENTRLEQGTCYISSNVNHVGLDMDRDGEPCLRYSNGNEKPLNLLFTSAARLFHQNTIGLLLTGIGDDGAEGFQKIKNESGRTIVQDAECCVYPNLTNNAIQKGVADLVIKENDLPRTIESLMK